MGHQQGLDSAPPGPEGVSVQYKSLESTVLRAPVPCLRAPGTLDNLRKDAFGENPTWVSGLSHSQTKIRDSGLVELGAKTNLIAKEPLTARDLGHPPMERT